MAAKHERDHAAGHVLVDAGEASGLDVDAGLLADLTASTCLDVLVEFEHSPRRLPSAVVVPLDSQDAAGAVDDDPGDAHVLPQKISREVVPTVAPCRRVAG